jgi:DNA-binding response OmpR family regulator
MGAKKPTVLIADDDPEILTMLSVRLQKRGWEVLEAVDGPQTLRVAREHKPDLVVLDVMMPGKSGWEVAREMRSDPELRVIGIVMLTAMGETLNEKMSPLYGADEYVDKPFDFADLESRLRKILEKRQSLS